MAEYIADPVIGWRYKPDSEGKKITRAFTNNYDINSKGFNWTEFKEKKEGVFRIMFLGYSDECGIETNGLNNYIKILQEKNIENNNKIEIINRSVNGRGKSFLNLKFLEEEVLKYKPDLVLMKFDFPVKHNPTYRTSYRGYVINHRKYSKSLKETKDFIDENYFKANTFKLLI